MGKVLCPYCFEEIKPNEVEFRCSNVTKKIDGSFVCGLENDEKIAIYQGLNNPLPMHKAFKYGKFSFGMPKQAICPGCGTESKDRICPHCHNKLPNYYGETDNLMLAVIGAKETGKSHYVAVLIDYIVNVLTGTFNFAVSAANDETSRRYKEVFRKNVFIDHVIIEATRSAQVDRRVKEPLIYEIKFHDSKLKIKKTVTIAFFDTAGEDLNAEDTMSVVNRYIYNASGIILLLDPLQLKGVRDSLPEGTPLPALNTEIETIVERTVRLIRKAKGMKSKSKIDIPLAAAFTKIDAIMPLLPAGSVIRNPGPHYNLGMFDLMDCKNVSDEMEALINQWAGSDFLAKVKTEFETYCYFGLSALGCNPHTTRRIDKVIPHRVEDPFLWLLWKHHLIEGANK